MPLTPAQKLRIKDGMKILTVNAPADAVSTLGKLAKKIQVADGLKEYDQVHWFVKTKAEMEKQVSKVLKLVKGDVLCWIYYPKGSSKIQTDLTRDKGWETLLKETDLQWINLISFDDTWSAFAMRRTTEKDKKKAEVSIERPIFQYIDAATKTITLPDDLASALKKDKAAGAYFDSLAYSHRKEYVEWIVTAKREETRTERIKGTLERLGKKWKNPRNL